MEDVLKPKENKEIDIEEIRKNFDPNSWNGLLTYDMVKHPNAYPSIKKEILNHWQYEEMRFNLGMSS